MASLRNSGLNGRPGSMPRLRAMYSLRGETVNAHASFGELRLDAAFFLAWHYKAVSSHRTPKTSLAVNPLPDLLSAKRANPIEPKRKYDAMFVAQPDIESVELG